MFTGLIQGIGRVQKLTISQRSIELIYNAPLELLTDYRIGDSMAINGVCLTATTINQSQVTTSIMPETYKRTTFQQLSHQSKLNLERAMLATSRFEGHLVTGHIDTKTRLVEKKKNEIALLLIFAYPINHQGEIISQGSVALNGVSLTVTQVTAQTFTVSMIPHSTEKTNLSDLRIGETVNLETDLLGKYVKAQRGIKNNHQTPYEAFGL